MPAKTPVATGICVAQLSAVHQTKVPGRINELLAERTENQPDAVAILDGRRAPLTYAALDAQIRQIAAALNALGIGRNDRVAIVLPNGPEMAVAFLATAAGATCAPLNPDYRAEEFDFYLEDLNARALIVQQDFTTAARDVARARSIPTFELVPSSHTAGLFTILGESGLAPKPTSAAEGDDFALVLHTSGTTSRPRMVPLTHRNLCNSAGNVHTSMGLTSSDRCLNVMPLFHIHGLVGALLSSLASGGSVCCAPGFHATAFLDWIHRSDATWYTAVPTMQQAAVDQARRASTMPPSRLRFIRSCSSSLAPQLMADLERAFGVPVIEAYGMTEASHQIAINPLPPGRRKGGSVGLPSGTRVAILDEAGSMLPAGMAGEIAIRGESVMSGYAANPEATAKAFFGEWLKTGDLGYLDDDGYLFITGRLKEIINRGGEKIAPREVDEVLLLHPGVAQCVTFAAPHTTLGEEVAAAVVLRDAAGKSCS